MCLEPPPSPPAERYGPWLRCWGVCVCVCVCECVCMCVTSDVPPGLRVSHVPRLSVARANRLSHHSLGPALLSQTAAVGSTCTDLVRITHTHTHTHTYTHTR